MASVGWRQVGPRVLVVFVLTVMVNVTLAGAQESQTVSAADFPSIQAAIDSLPASGGMVTVPAGEYVLARKIRLPNDVELRGAGSETTILTLGDQANDHLISNRDLREGNRGIVIRDLGLRGNAAHQSDWSFGVRLVNVTDVLVERVEASDFTKDGFYLGYNNERGVHNVRVIECVARDNRRYGLALKHGTGNLVEGCVFERNGYAEEGSAVKLGPDEGLSVSESRIVRNRAVNNYAGFILEAVVGYGSHVANNAVCWNHAEGNTREGFRDFRGEGNRFIGNTASGNGIDFDLGPASDEAGC